nr:hypothetical protein B0A51_11031 [Rachicladosporium sp. CCFEE 5018]
MYDRVCHPKNEGNSLRDCFSSNSFAILQKQGLLSSVTHWISGHTHWNVDFKRDGVRMKKRLYLSRTVGGHDSSTKLFRHLNERSFLDTDTIRQAILGTNVLADTRQRIAIFAVRFGMPMHVDNLRLPDD